MKKPLVLAALSGLILVGAAYPDFDKPDDDQGVSSADGGQRYRPCRSRRDDNCIQLYERGVSARYARWLRDGDPGYDEAVRYAVYQDEPAPRGAMRRGHREHLADRGHREHLADHGHHRRHHHAAAAPAPRPGHARRPNARLAMVDVLRCDDRAAPRHVVRERVRREVIRPAPRPRMHEDSGVRGM